MTEFKWTRDRIFNLIEEYKKKPALWDSTNDFFKIQSKKSEAWNRIAKNMSLDVGEIRRKMGSLLAAYRRERLKITNMRKLGMKNLKAYRKKCWFAFSYFDFLNKNYTTRFSTIIAKTNPNYLPQPEKDENIQFISVDDSHSHDCCTPIKEEAKEEEEKEEHENYNDEEMEVVPVPVAYPELNLKEINNITPSSSVENKECEIKNNEIVKYTKERDVYDAYGEYVAGKLRNFDSYSRIYVQKAISDIFFEADLGRYKPTKSNNECQRD